MYVLVQQNENYLCVAEWKYQYECMAEWKYECMKYGMLCATVWSSVVH